MQIIPQIKPQGFEYCHIADLAFFLNRWIEINIDEAQQLQDEIDQADNENVHNEQAYGDLYQVLKDEDNESEKSKKSDDEESEEEEFGDFFWEWEAPKQPANTKQQSEWVCWNLNELWSSNNASS